MKEDMSAVTLSQISRPIAFRDMDEEIIDKVLLLHLINEVNKRGELRGITKLMKLVFFTENEIEANKVFEIDEEWLETFDTLLDKEEHISLMEGMESARTRPSERVEIFVRNVEGLVIPL